MEILKINKQQFEANEEFFKKNLAYVYDLYSATYNKIKTKTEIENSVFIGHQKFFEEFKDNCFLIIAKENEKIYSIASFERHKENFWYLDGMATRSERRGEHLATKVLEKGLSEISGKCYLHVDKDNIPAIKLYQNLGFSQDNEILDGYENVNNSYLLSKQVTQAKKQEEIKGKYGIYKS